MRTSAAENIPRGFTGTRVKCWEFFRCDEHECPAFSSESSECWLFTGTHCRNEIQGKFLDKIELCTDCGVFKRNMDMQAVAETCRVFNQQLKEYRKLVEDRDRELKNMSMELALALSEVFEALKKISSGDPTVRIPESSHIELISKLKHMINMTARNIGEIVDQSHEIAISIAEHFDVLHRVSKGDLSARVSGGSEIELLESLKNVTNETIESISREIAERNQAEEELKSSREQLRYLSAHLQSAIEEERMYISRDIHDEMGQLLTALKMDLFWLNRKIQKNLPKKSLLMKIESMSELIDEAVKAVQKKSADLRPGLLDDLGLTAAIEWQASEFSKRTGFECKLNLDFSEDIIMNQDVATAIYRIFQEALTNVARHANAFRLKISLRQEGDRVALEVSDNGKGITEDQIRNAKSYGLTGIRERVHLLRGDVTIEGIPGKGTTIKVSIPLEKNAETAF
ncbi:MAG: sensor histidine kinase [Nitrospirota bacterium]